MYFGLTKEKSHFIHRLLNTTLNIIYATWLMGSENISNVFYDCSRSQYRS